jgi:hypothetical protein
MKTYKLTIKINDKEEIQSIKETLVSDERCLEVDDVEITDHMDAKGVELLRDACEIGIA